MITLSDTTTPLLEITDASFRPAQRPEYDLCMEIGSERFRFGVINAANRQVLALEDYSIDAQITHQSLNAWLNTLFTQHAYLGYGDWHLITLSFNTPHFTLVPDPYFRKEYVSTYLNLIRGADLSAGEQVLHHALPILAARNVFAVNQAVWEYLLGNYSLSTPNCVHQTSALIASLLTQSASQEAPRMHLYFEEGFLTVAIAAQSQLLFCNKFPYKSSADMAYFVMFVLDSLQLSPQDIRCFLYGEITAYSEDYQLVKRFLGNPQFGVRPTHLVFGEAFDDVPEHRYATLFDLPLTYPTPS